ncbi:MAG: hypothetical protein V1767_00670 [Chloroflexota bacterium]
MTYTPWGESDSQHKLADGIILYGTPSHGGIHVRDDLNTKIPDYMRNENGWYEEDCEWCKVAIIFCKAFDGKQNKAAVDTFRSYFPDAYEKYFHVSLKPGESMIRDEHQFFINHKNDYIVVTARGDHDHGVPKGMVQCFAVRGGRDANGHPASDQEAYFLVPEAEYQLRNHYGFVVDEAKHKRVG